MATVSASYSKTQSRIDIPGGESEKTYPDLFVLAHPPYGTGHDSSMMTFALEQCGPDVHFHIDEGQAQHRLCSHQLNNVPAPLHLQLLGMILEP